MITLVVGGTRSGKSVLAERLVLAHAGPLTYLATGRAGDADMATRIEWHRHRRDARFTTVEVGNDLAAALRAAPAIPTLVDALGTWVACQPEFAADGDEAGGAGDWTGRIEALAGALGARRAPTVLVSDEVGMGVHPETAAGRRFRDVLGLVNQAVAEVADDVLLVMAGRALRLDRIDAVEPAAAGEPDDPAP